MAAALPSRPAGAFVPRSSDGSIRRRPDTVHTVAGGMADPYVLAPVVFVVASPFLAALRAGADADHVDRAVRRVVVGVAEEILRRELPVGGEHPFVDADHFGAAWTAIAAVQHLIEVFDRGSEIIQEVGSQ